MEKESNKILEQGSTMNIIAGITTQASMKVDDKFGVWNDELAESLAEQFGLNKDQLDKYFNEITVHDGGSRITVDCKKCDIMKELDVFSEKVYELQEMMELDEDEATEEVLGLEVNFYVEDGEIEYAIIGE